MRFKLFILFGLSLISLGLTLFSNRVFAGIIGNYGQVFPVIELDIRQVIMSRLQQMQASGELANHQKIIQERLKAHIIRPSPLNLLTTDSPEIFHIDASIQVSRDIFTPEGILLARKGTRINPFERIKLSKTLIFFNGDDANQVAWVRKHYKDYNFVKFILTGGNIEEAAKLFGRIYFDIGGQLKNKLQLRHVPSVVNQEGLFWKVKEIGVNGA